MKALFVFIVLIVGFNAQANDGLFDMGCLSWTEVEKVFDLSQISGAEKASLQKAHEEARNNLSVAEAQFYKEGQNPETKALICAIVAEATLGFQTQCLNDAGQEIISATLAEDCLSNRL